MDEYEYKFEILKVHYRTPNLAERYHLAHSSIAPFVPAALQKKGYTETASGATVEIEVPYWGEDEPGLRLTVRVSHKE